MKIYKIILSILLSFSIASCGNRNDDTLIVATSADNPPYESMKNGELVGFDIDLAHEIGKHLNKKIEIRNMEFQGLLAALVSDSVDMVLAGMSVTKKRKEKIDFSIPYNTAKVSVIFRKDDNFKSEEDLADKTIGAQLGTIWSLIAHEMSTKNEFTILSLSNNLMLIEELKNGRIDAVILEEAQVIKFIEKNPNLSSFSADEYGSSFAIAMPKGSKIKKEVDNAIVELHKNGTIDKIAQKWGIN